MKKLMFSVLIISFICTISSAKKNDYLKKDTIKTGKGDIVITPIKHTSFVIEAGNKTIFVDPVGDMKQFKKFKTPDFILLTDIHGDHLSIDLVNKLKRNETKVIGPKAVAEQGLKLTIINYNEEKKFDKIIIRAVPSYNITKERLMFHAKGRGNGYVISVLGKRIYISGDTEDIPEMRTLKNIDIAFICMNLPYTMTEKQAASAVLDFKPTIVYPFHYRGKKNEKTVYSNIKLFKQLVSKNKNIDVRFLKWY